MLDIKKLSRTELLDYLANSKSDMQETRNKSHLQYLSHDLEVHQIELEMQNRELREAQRELEISRDRYADLYDFAPISYLSIDGKGIIHDLNLTGATMLGQERKSIIGAPFSKFIVPGDEIKLFNHLKSVFQSNHNVIDELQLHVKKSSPLDVQIESRVSAHGDGLCRMAVTNISERKHYENKLIQAREEAETANAVKTRFLSRISHELRTPLNGILGFAQIMDMSADDSTISEHRENITTLIHSGWLLLRIIDDLLDLSALEANNLDIHLEQVNVADCLEDCIKTMLPLAAHRHIDIKFSQPGSDAMQVWADSPRLKQVLLSLIANAVKHNHDGGSVSVSCASAASGNIRIVISDTGPGIHENDLATLFQPFSRLPDRPYSVQGAGIGLSVSKQLTELMGGSLGVESEFGKGSNFWVEFPMDEK